jgi:hypothetical protein
MNSNKQLQTQKKTTNASPRHQNLKQMTRTVHPASIIQRTIAGPESLTTADVLQLQHTIGNQAVGQLLAGIGRIPSTTQQAPVQRQELEEEELLQGKMIETVQRQGLPEEEELMQGKMMDTVQRQEPEEEELLQGKFTDECVQCQMPEEEEELMQGKFASGLTGTLQAKEEAPPNRTGMPDHLKSGLENLSGMDLSGVRVQYGSSKPAQLNALAYTRGQEIHVAPGQEKHLPHEGWHAVQQMQGRVKPTMQARSVAINDDVGLEREADIMGAKVLQIPRPNASATGAAAQAATESGRQGPRVKGWTGERVVQRNGKSLALGFSDLKNDEYNAPDFLGNLPQVEKNLSEFRAAIGAVGPEALGAKGVKQQAEQGMIQPQFGAGIKKAMVKAKRIKQNVAGFTQEQIDRAYGHKPVLDESEIELLKQFNPDYSKLMLSGKVVDRNITGKDATDWFEMKNLRSDVDDKSTEGHHPEAWHPALSAISVWELSHLLHNKILFDKTDFYYYDGKVKELKKLESEQLEQYGIRQSDNLMTTKELGLPEPKSSKCFITTACVEAEGLPDDCEELTILRAFRDGFMSSLPNGAALISEYYNIAPRIVARISTEPDAEIIFASLYESVSTSADMVKAGKNDEAMRTYVTIVSDLKEKYL